jgi:6-pyruvoyl-tetrahydropterin synthase
MKYLKYFENNSLSEDDISYHLDEIKNIFQDYIDEYDIEELPDDLEENDDSKPGIYYHIYNFCEATDKFRRPNGVLRRSQFELTLYCYGEFTHKNIIWEKYFKLIAEDIDKYAERLREVGYIVKYELPVELVRDHNPEQLVEDPEFNISIALEKFTS